MTLARVSLSPADSVAFEQVKWLEKQKKSQPYRLLPQTTPLEPASSAGLTRHSPATFKQHRSPEGRQPSLHTRSVVLTFRQTARHRFWAPETIWFRWSGFGVGLEAGKLARGQSPRARKRFQYCRL